MGAGWNGAGERVAFFGGSFDPPHEGHLAIARAARDALDLDRVLFAPVGAQPLKPDGSSAAFDDRVQMTRLAIAGERGFEVSLVDAPKAQGAPNYTLETLLALRAGLTPDGLLFLLMGADSFLSLRSWHRAAEIPFAAELIVASRPGQRLDDLQSALPAGLTLSAGPEQVSAHCGADVAGAETGLRCYTLRGGSGSSTLMYVLSGLHFDVSASQVRENLYGAASADEVGSRAVPAAVMDYIRAHGLYLPD